MASIICLLQQPVHRGMRGFWKRSTILSNVPIYLATMRPTRLSRIGNCLWATIVGTVHVTRWKLTAKNLMTSPTQEANNYLSRRSCSIVDIGTVPTSDPATGLTVGSGRNETSNHPPTPDGWFFLETPGAFRTTRRKKSRERCKIPARARFTRMNNGRGRNGSRFLRTFGAGKKKTLTIN